jgi:hypothetical protein
VDNLRWALSWLVVRALGSRPSLAYWAVGLIGWAFWSRRGGSPTGSAPVQPQEGKGGNEGNSSPTWPLSYRRNRSERSVQLRRA